MAADLERARVPSWPRAGLAALGCMLVLAVPARAAQAGSNEAGVPAPRPSAVYAADIDPLAITPEMAAFVDEKVSARQSRRARLLRLQEVIFDDQEGLGVTYGSTETHTAAGTFRERTGNCLSFTLLFAALARHLELEIYFIEVDEVTGWSQRGRIGFSHWHMYAEVEIENAKVPVDFLPWTERRYRSSRRISEPRVRAHFHNNIGADRVAAGSPGEALAHLERALALDPSFQPARINLAVAHRRLGNLARAEELLVNVLDADSRNPVAAANLAMLYTEQGRFELAARWQARRQAFLDRNPFHHFRLGVDAFGAGSYREARDHFKRAIARQGDEPLFFEQLAETQARLGQLRKARSSLRRALWLTESPELRQKLEERMRQSDLRPPEPS